MSDQRVAPAKSVVAVMSHVRLPNPDPQIGRSHPDSGRNARHSVYRASGLVLWHIADIVQEGDNVRFGLGSGHPSVLTIRQDASILVSELVADDLRVDLARSHAACPIVMLLRHARIGVVKD